MVPQSLAAGGGGELKITQSLAKKLHMFLSGLAWQNAGERFQSNPLEQSVLESLSKHS